MSKKINHIDDLYRNRFDNYHPDPPEYIWKNIRNNLDGNVAAPKANHLNKGGIAGLTIMILFLIFLSGYFIFGTFSEKETANNHDYVLKSNTELASGLIADNVHHHHPENDESIISSVRGIYTDKPDQQPAGQPIEIEKIQDNDDSIVADIAISLKNKPVRELTDNEPAHDLRPIIRMEGMRAGLISTYGLTSQNYSLTSLQHSYKAAHKKSRSVGYTNTGQFRLGLFFTPEVIYHQGDRALQNKSKSIDIQVLYEKNNILLQSGAGINLVSDAGSHQIEFNKYRGSYEHVNGVIFDSVGGELNISYITETVHVYDTISYIRITSTTRQFTYLQVPFLVGYYNEINRFKWFIKTGPSLSFKLHEKVPASSVDDYHAKILNIENELPSKISTHWQLMFSAGASYKLGNKLSLSVEPLFRYYIKSDYERNDRSGDHPYSIGLKTGIIFDF